MKTLDHCLLFKAHYYINGANVHRVKEMILAYRQAVDLHNRQWNGHQIYRMQSELQLRAFVFEEQMVTLRNRRDEATEKANLAIRKSKNASKTSHIY